MIDAGLDVNFENGEAKSTRLMTEKEIAGAAIRFESSDMCGVYFLVKDDRVVYVGQSKNVFSRIIMHRRNCLDFDGFSYIRCSADVLDTLESLYIHILSPNLNKSFGESKRAPISFDHLLKKIHIKTPAHKLPEGMSDPLAAKVSAISAFVKESGVGIIPVEGNAGLSHGTLTKWLNHGVEVNAEDVERLEKSAIKLAIEEGAIPIDCDGKTVAELIELAKGWRG